MSSATVYKNVTPAVQESLSQWWTSTLNRHGTFASSIAAALALKEIELVERDPDGKMQAKATFEITVGEDMINFVGSLHGGCAVYLTDICSSMALAVLAMSLGKDPGFVAQALNTTFHAPAPLGAKIEIVNTTIALGARTVSTITEIWDVTNRRLCVTGVHSKMAPSTPAKVTAHL